MNDEHELTVLPFEISAQIRVRRRGQISDWKLVGDGQDEIRFAIAALSEDYEALERMTDVMQRLQLLVPADEAPACAEDLAFRLDLTPELMGLLPPRPSAEDENEDDASFILNPRLFVQEGRDLPAAVVDRIHLEPDTSSGPPTFDPELPIVWVEAPRTRLLFPLWFGGPWGKVVRDVVLGRADPREVPAAIRAALRAACILVRRDDVDGAWLSPRPEPNVVRLPGLLPPALTAGLCQYFRSLREHGFFGMDRQQVPGKRAGLYRDLLSMFVQHQVAGILERELGVDCRPSYTWYMLYGPGAELVRHVDRPQCRWNVSLCIDNVHGLAPERWPLELDVDGRTEAVALDQGDGVLYSGTKTPHWRRPLPEGHAIGNMFLHFVDPSFDGPTY